MLRKYYNKHLVEAGCDEAGRGCLAGPVFAAAVILPRKFRHPLLNDSKLLKEEERNELRVVIEEQALAWSVQQSDVKRIDKINILHASIYAMHLALDDLKMRPEHILVDGNFFTPYDYTAHTCVVKGDSKYACIAAASVLAKTHRDDYMKRLHRYYPSFKWNENKGYPTLYHRRAVLARGKTKHHRKSFIIRERNDLNLS